MCIGDFRSSSRFEIVKYYRCWKNSVRNRRIDIEFNLKTTQLIIVNLELSVTLPTFYEEATDIKLHVSDFTVNILKLEAVGRRNLKYKCGAKFQSAFHGNSTTHFLSQICGDCCKQITVYKKHYNNTSIK